MGVREFILLDGWASRFSFVGLSTRLRSWLVSGTAYESGLSTGLAGWLANRRSWGGF
jgi:hypothetical protein